MKKLTARQIEVLTNARDTGNPYRRADGQDAPGSWTTGYRMVVERMQKAGYLYGHTITTSGVEALDAQTAKAPAAQEAVVIEGETISAASAIAQAADIAQGIPTVVTVTQDGYTTCDFGKRTMKELVHFCDGLIAYVDEGGQVEMGSSPHMAGMREGHEVEDLIYQVNRAWSFMNRWKHDRTVMALTRTTAVVLLGRMRLALDLAWDKSQDGRDVEARRTFLALRGDMWKLKDSFAKSVDGAK